MFDVLFFDRFERLVYHYQAESLDELYNEMVIHFCNGGHVEIWENNKEQG